MKKDTTPVVDAIAKLDITGDVIPHGWKQSLVYRTKNDEEGRMRGYGLAWLILAEIIYFYRPTIVRDERTGKVKSVHKKFRADKLQKSYDNLAEANGFTKNQVKDAIQFLVASQAITIEFRTVNVGSVKLGNVMFVEPIVESIIKYNEGVRLFDIVRLAFKSYSVKKITDLSKKINTPSINFLKDPVLKNQYTNTREYKQEISIQESISCPENKFSAPQAIEVVGSEISRFQNLAWSKDQEISLIRDLAKTVSGKNEPTENNYISARSIYAKVLKKIVTYDQEKNGKWLKGKKSFSRLIKNWIKDEPILHQEYDACLEVIKQVGKVKYGQDVPTPSQRQAKNLNSILLAVEEHPISTEYGLSRGLQGVLNNLPTHISKNPEKLNIAYLCAILVGQYDKAMSKLKTQFEAQKRAEDVWNSDDEFGW